METMSARNDTSARGRLTAQLAGIEQRLQNEGEVPPVDFPGGDFLDVAQGVERARRLRIALTRLQDGDYGICSNCRAPIPPARLRALPDTTTCVACQAQLERYGAA